MSFPQDPTGAPASPGVPVVDITATVRGLYRHADEMREAARDAERTMTRCRAAAAHFEQIAAVLQGADHV